MATKGPIPKRSEQRRRRNEVPRLEQAPGARVVRVPAASKDWHPVAAAWYRSLRTSGQSRFYEPSDWATARYIAELMSVSLRTDEPNAALVSAIVNGTRDLMTTEGQRRRMNLELTRARSDDSDEQAEAEARVLAIAGA